MGRPDRRLVQRGVEERPEGLDFPRTPEVDNSDLSIVHHVSGAVLYLDRTSKICGIKSPYGDFRRGDEVIPSEHAPHFVVSRNPNEPAFGKVVDFTVDTAEYLTDIVLIVRFRGENHRLKLNEVLPTRR